MSQKVNETPFLPFRVLNEVGIISQLSSNALQRLLPHNLTVARHGVLNHCVRMGDGKTPTQIARAMQVTKGAMTNTLNRLEAQKFIRVVPDPEDARGKIVFLTAEGRKAREDCIAATIPDLSVLEETLGHVFLKDLLPKLEVLRRYLDEARDNP